MDLFDEIVSALRSEDRVMLATIISTTGSTPASALSKMLVKEGGVVSLGSVGGGCMEGDVLLHASRLLAEHRSDIITFDLTEDDIEHGLICGGSLNVLIEPLSKEQIPLFEKLKAIRDGGDDCVLATHLAGTGDIRSKSILSGSVQTPIEQSAGAREVLEWIERSGDAGLRPSIIEGILRVQHDQETLVVQLAEGRLVLEPVAGAPGLLIFGGGHVSKYISRTAAMAGFRVSIFDDRRKFANRERFPEAARVLEVDFSDAFRDLTVNSSAYIVIVTRGHRYDEEVLRQAIKTPARYIGMIGSRRKVLTAFEHLVGEGIPPVMLERVRAPIGIDISAISAEEIGISVTAELVAERRGGQSPFRRKSDVMRDLIARIEQEHADQHD
jgi:xanthine dehydrogenase accessory factor